VNYDIYKENILGKIMNETSPCPYCKKIFTLVENQGDKNWEVKIKESDNQLIHYQQHK
jgi:hypothetical protein